MMKTDAIEKVIGLLECVDEISQGDYTFYGDRLAEWGKAARAELAALKSTAEDLECLLGEAQVENKMLREWAKALMSLTPGGSEYVDDPARCVAFVRRKEEGLSKAMKRFKKRADKATEKCLGVVQGQTTMNMAEVDLLRRIEIDIERLERKE